MKILIATSGYFPTHGGQSTHIINLCKGLKALGNDVTVVSLSNYPVPFVKALHGGLGQILDIVKIGQFYRFKLRQYLLSNIMKQCGNKHGTWDVIDAQDPIALLVAKKLGYRVLLTVHGEGK
jgi:glycosyltransferase involved in cell wall biosynthesis